MYILHVESEESDGQPDQDFTFVRMTKGGIGIKKWQIVVIMIYIISDIYYCTVLRNSQP